VLTAALTTGCATTRVPLLTDDLNRLGLAEAVEDHAFYLEHGAKLGGLIDGVGLGEQRVSRAQYAAALRRFAKVVRSAASDRELARAVEAEFELREVMLDQPFKVTAYYEPIVPGSRVRQGAFTQPLYRAPPELVPGRPFHTRHEIDSEHVLEGRGLEICWVDPIVAFVLQTEGSGTIVLDDGTHLPLDHDGTNNLPHVSVSKKLADVLPKEHLSMHAIEVYLRSLPEPEMRALLEQNPRYGFFKPRPPPGTARSSGPATSMGLRAHAGRTIAIDPRVVPMGALVFLQSEQPRFETADAHEPASWRPLGRFVLAQDTGGGILGARVDLYWGEGPEAERNAGVMKQPGRLFYLVPKEVPKESSLR
jgi:membrane-bound lytic murein transglycosylase A